MDHFQLRNGELYAEDVAAGADRRGSRHAGLRLFARDARAARAGVPRGARCDPAQAHRLRGEGQPQPRGAARARPRGLRRRRRLGRRDEARAGGGHRRPRHRLLGRRQDRARDGRRRSTPGSASSTSSSRRRASSCPRSPTARGCSARLRAARQSRRRCRHARQDLDRQGRQQVRRRRIDLTPPASTPGWRRCPGLEMRGLAVHIGSQLADLAAARTGVRQGRRAARRRCAPPGTPSATSTSAAGSACPTSAGDELPSPAEYGAMVARVTARLGRRADVRARAA